MRSSASISSEFDTDTWETEELELGIEAGIAANMPLPVLWVQVRWLWIGGCRCGGSTMVGKGLGVWCGVCTCGVVGMVWWVHVCCGVCIHTSGIGHGSAFSMSGSTWADHQPTAGGRQRQLPRAVQYVMSLI